MVIGWTPNDGSRPPTPGDEARRAFFMVFVLLAALCGVVGTAASMPVLLVLAVPSALIAAALLLWPGGARR